MDYHAPSWLPGGHLQTLYSALIVQSPAIGYQRECWDTPDGDFIELDWLGSNATQPLVVLFHGLEGSSASHYAAHLMAYVRKEGWNGVVVHFRGCGGQPNRLARAYHAGVSAEIDWVLRQIRARFPQRQLFACGISLGGNALLKWLGEQAQAASSVIQAAVAISSVIDLQAAGNTLDRGLNRHLYTRRFLATLKRKSLAKLQLYPHLYSRQAVAQAYTLRVFDNLVTAPLHGFTDVNDYWSRASSKPLLNGIQVPTLMINARNDPFMPANALPAPNEVSAAVTLCYPEQGGHVGFTMGRFPGHFNWLPQKTVHFFQKNENNTANSSIRLP